MLTTTPSHARRSRLFPNLQKGDRSFLPGVLELKFKEHVRPLVVAATDGANSVESQSGADLSRFHDLLTVYRVKNLAPIFSVTHEEADRWQRQARERGHHVQHLGHYFRVQVENAASTESLAAALRALPEVEYASRVPRLTQGSLPNDPLLGTLAAVVPSPPGTIQTQWYVFRCKADQAWTLATGKGVAVAVIDQGFTPDHEDLKPNVDMTFNVNSNSTQIDNTKLKFGDERHGTSAAGMAAAAGDNGLGVTGFAYGAKLWLLQSELHPLLISTAIEKVVSTTRTGIARRVLSISLGFLAQDGTTADATLDAPLPAADPKGSLRAIIDTAIAADIVVCLIAGNDRKTIGRDVGTDATGKPFAASDAIIVAATKYNETDINDNSRYPQSNWGPNVTVCAPGDPLFDVACTPEPQKYYNHFGLTSSACPKVAGTAALMLEANPSLTHAQVKTILNGSATFQEPQMYDKPVGPFLNSFEAVKQSVSTPGPHLIANRFLNFGNVQRGTKSPPQTVRVFNIGKTPLHLTSMSRTDGNSDFAVEPLPSFPITLAPGAAPAVFNFVFSPSFSLDTTAIFALVSDDPASPLEIKCTGTAPFALTDIFKVLGWIGIVATGVGAIVLLILILLGKIKL